MKFNTKTIHAGLSADLSTGAIMTPIYQTSTYVQDSPGEHKGFEYSRTGNPTRLALEKNISALENGKYGLCYSSGLAAIDSVIIVAGYVGGMPENQTIDNVDLDEWHRTLNINTIGPLLVARSFKENLSASGNGNLMILSSQLAASTWPMGGMYIYSTTKAAVGKVGKILSLDWAEDPVTVSIMHPGWVQTDMGGPGAEITAEESASGIISVISNLTKEDSGNFYKWNGDIHPW